MAENDLDSGNGIPRARQTMFAMGLAQGMTVRDAAKSAGISESTAYRWRGDPGVAVSVNHYRDLIIGETVGLVAKDARSAVKKIVSLLESGNERIQLDAAKTLLGELQKFTDKPGTKAKVGALPVVLQPQKPIKSDSSNIWEDIDLSHLHQADPYDEELPSTSKNNWGFENSQRTTGKAVATRL